MCSFYKRNTVSNKHAVRKKEPCIFFIPVSQLSYGFNEPQGALVVGHGNGPKPAYTLNAGVPSAPRDVTQILLANMMALVWNGLYFQRLHLVGTGKPVKALTLGAGNPVLEGRNHSSARPHSSP